MTPADEARIPVDIAWDDFGAVNARRAVGTIIFGAGVLATLAGTYLIATSSSHPVPWAPQLLGVLSGGIGLLAMPLGAWLLSGRSGLPLFGSISLVAGLFALIASVDQPSVLVILASTAAAYWMGRGRRGISGWFAVVAGFVAGLLLGDLVTLSLSADDASRSTTPQPAWQPMFVASLGGTAVLMAVAYTLGHGRGALRWSAVGGRERLELIVSGLVLAAVVLTSTALLGTSAAVLPTDAQVVRVEVREEGVTMKPETVAAGDVYFIIQLRSRSQTHITFFGGSLSEIGIQDLANGKHPQSPGAYVTDANSYTKVFNPGDRDEYYWANPQNLQPGRYAFWSSFSGPPYSWRWALLTVS